MPYTVESFGRQVHDILAQDPSPTGRERVRVLLEEVLRDEAFVAQHLTDDSPQRRVLYHDEELGFVILGHHFREARRTKPHDHGAYWAIYGQAAGITFMDEWEIVEAGTRERPGKVRKKTTYELAPGHAHTYNEGVLHSPWRNGPAKMIRIEGGPIEAEGRVAYEVV
jgi:predicted metal-dependent enzyme (double-stranded beta helix superfamily)